MRRPTSPAIAHPRLLTAVALWLLGGTALLLTTLVPAHTALLGWSPVFWLALAPLAMLLVLEPSLPRQLLTLRRRRGPARHGAVWH